MMRYRYLSIFIFITVLAVFSLWPSIIDAHYSGLISCPIIFAPNMIDCSSMASHMTKIISHIADFMIMIAFILPFIAIVAFILRSVKNCDFFKNFISVLKSKVAFYANSQNFLISEIKTKTSIFLAFKKGILNTKVF